MPTDQPLDGPGETLSELPHGRALAAFAEAVVRQDAAAAERLRSQLIDRLGMAGFVDACAVVAGFHGFTRIADATGIELEEVRPEAAALVQSEIGVTDPKTRGH